MKTNHFKYMPWVGVLVIGVAVGIVLTSNLGWTPKGIAGKQTESTVLGAQTKPSAELVAAQNTSRAFTVISKEMLPAVVSIATSKTIKRSPQED
ncbi:MAG TPA: hypothetical protein VGB38_07345, partial [bacterium]